MSNDGAAKVVCPMASSRRYPVLSGVLGFVPELSQFFGKIERTLS